jgi:hypothetical protein
MPGRSDGSECLTAAQVETARKIMAPESRTGSEVFLGLERGGELGWGGLTGGPEPNGDGIGQFKYIVFENPNWDWRPNSFDMLTALEQWVEKGQAPGQIVASHSTAGSVDRTRPLCPYPQVASYTGTGSIDDAASFVCRMP